MQQAARKDNRRTLIILLLFVILVVVVYLFISGNIMNKKDEEINSKHIIEKPIRKDGNDKDHVVRRGSMKYSQSEIRAVIKASDFFNLPQDQLPRIQELMLAALKEKYTRNANVYKSEYGNIMIVTDGKNNDLFDQDGRPKFSVSIGPRTPNVIFNYPFDEYSSVLDEQREWFDKIKKTIINNKDDINQIIVVGYTDDLGSEEYNYNLSLKRCISVMNEFSNHGIILVLVPRGEQDPIASNVLPEGRAKNRRVEIFITSKDTLNVLPRDNS